MKGNKSFLVIWVAIFSVSFTYYFYDGIPDKSGKRIGKVSLLEGILEVRNQNFQVWQKSFIDEPILQGSSLWTGANSHAEVHLESGQIIKLAPLTLITLTVPEDSSQKNYLVSLIKGKIEVDQKAAKKNILGSKLAILKKVESAKTEASTVKSAKDVVMMETTDVYTLERREDESLQLSPVSEDHTIASPTAMTEITPVAEVPTLIPTTSAENTLLKTRLMEPTAGEKFWFVQERSGGTLAVAFSTPIDGNSSPPDHEVSLLVSLNRGPVEKFPMDASKPGRMTSTVPLGKIFKAREGERIKKPGDQTQVDFCLSAGAEIRSLKDCQTDVETIFISDVSQVNLSRSSVFVKFPLNLKGTSGLIRERSDLKAFDVAINFRDYSALYKFFSKSSLPTQFSIRPRRNFGNFYFVDGNGKTLASLSQLNDSLKETDLEKIAHSISATLIYSGKESDLLARDKFTALSEQNTDSDLYILKEKESMRIDRRLLTLHPSAATLLKQHSPYIFQRSVPIIWRADQ